MVCIECTLVSKEDKEYCPVPNTCPIIDRNQKSLNAQARTKRVEKLNKSTINETKEVTYISTSTHGYIKVLVKDVKRLGIKVTDYSFTKGEYIYLEEDIDAQTYLDALDNRGIDYIVKSRGR